MLAVLLAARDLLRAQRPVWRQMVRLVRAGQTATGGLTRRKRKDPHRSALVATSALGPPQRLARTARPAGRWAVQVQVAAAMLGELRPAPPSQAPCTALLRPGTCGE